MKKKDYISGSFLVILSAMFIFEGRKLAFWGHSGPLEGFCPLIASSMVGLCGVTILVQALLRAEETKQTWVIFGPDRRKLFLYVASFLAVALIFKKVGFLLTQTAFFVLILRVAEKKPWRIILAVTIPTMLISYVVFVLLFSVELPEGILGSIISPLK